MKPLARHAGSTRRQRTAPLRVLDPLMMNEQPFDMSIVIFALLAAFLIWKLRSVLGTRNDDERPGGGPVMPGRWSAGYSQKPRSDAPAGNGQPSDSTAFRRHTAPANGSAQDQRENNEGPGKAPRDWSAFIAPGAAAAPGLDAIAAADPAFEPRAFIEGARAAYEMIVNAFAKGQRDVLAPLLTPDVFAGFNGAITEREKHGQTIDFTFVSLDSAKITEAALVENHAEITLRYEAKMIKVTRDAQGNVVDGSPDHVVDAHELWTFERPVDARDPNWKLAATKSED